MISFSDYLARLGFFGTKTPEEWKYIRNQYNKFYQKEYHKTYRKGLKRVEISFTPKEYVVVTKSAKLFGISTTAFMYKAIYSVLNSETFLPPNEDVNEVKKLIRKCSHNVNQIVYGSHRHQAIYKESLESLVKEFNRLEKTLDEFYKKAKTKYKPINDIEDADKIS
jgi:glutathionyl-hydroquinone reductase